MLSVTDWENNTFYIRYFKSLNDFISTATSAAREQNRKLDYLEINQQRGFKYPDQNKLKEYLQDFENFINDADLGGDIKKEKLKITDDERGIFDFSLASQGLYRSLEYYSKELELESPNEFPNKEAGIVPDNFVITHNILNKNIFTYKSKSGKEYELTQQQEGTKKMLSLNPNAQLKTTNGGLIYASPTTYNGFSLKFKTKNKKNYLLFEKKGGKAKMVDIYFPIHASVKLYNILPSILLSKFLESLNIQTRIYALRVYEENNNQWGLFAYPIKEYSDPLNIDYIAFNSAKEEFYYNNWSASWWDGVKDMVVSLLIKDLRNSPYQKSGYGIARGNSGQGSPPSSRKDWVELFSRYRNWYLEQIKKGEVEPLRIDKKLIFFGGSTFDNNKGDRKQRVLNDFYLMLDKVDMQFNEKDSFERIYKRKVEKELSSYLEKYNENKGVNGVFYDSEDFDSFRKIYLKSKYEKNNLGYAKFDDYLSNMALINDEYLIWKRDTPIKDLYNYEDFYKQINTWLKYRYKEYVINDVLIETYTYPVGGEYAEEKESAEKLDKEFEEKIEKLENFLSKK